MDNSGVTQALVPAECETCLRVLTGPGAAREDRFEQNGTVRDATAIMWRLGPLEKRPDPHQPLRQRAGGTVGGSAWPRIAIRRTALVDCLLLVSAQLGEEQWPTAL